MRIRYAYFFGIKKEIFLRWTTDGVVVMLLAFETFYLGSVLIKIKTLNFCANKVNFFCNQFWDLRLEIFQKFLKVGLKST